jgi:hypothetical protein
MSEKPINNKALERTPKDCEAFKQISEALIDHQRIMWDNEGLMLNNVRNKNARAPFKRTWRAAINDEFIVSARLRRRQSA